MFLFNFFQYSPSKNDIVFKAHPYRRGYAKLVDEDQLSFVKELGFNNCVNSRDFEILQEKAEKANKKVFWLSK